MKVRRYQAVLPKEGRSARGGTAWSLARKECIGRAHAELGAAAVFLNEETRVEERLLGLLKHDVVEMLFATDLEGTALQGQARPFPGASPAAVPSPPRPMRWGGSKARCATCRTRCAPWSVRCPRAASRPWRSPA